MKFGTMPEGDSRIFLCHSAADKQAVRGLHARLIADGFHPWLDEEDLIPGQDWDREITQAVRSSEIVIVCLSKSSIGKAGYVQREIKQALDVADEQPEGRIFIIPVRLEECDVPQRLARWQWVNLFDANGYSRLLRALQTRGLSPRHTQSAAGPPVRLTVHRAYFAGSPVEQLFINATNLSESDLVVTHVWFATEPEVHVVNERRALPKRLQPRETWETWIATALLPPDAQVDPFTRARARLSTGEVIQSVENVGVPQSGFVPGAAGTATSLGPITETLAMIFVDLMRLFYSSASKAAENANKNRYLNFLVITERHCRDLQAHYLLFGAELGAVRTELGRLDRRISWVLERFRLGPARGAREIEGVYNALTDMAGMIDRLCAGAHPDRYASSHERVKQYLEERLGGSEPPARVSTDDLYHLRLQAQNALLEDDSLKSIADDIDQRLGIPYFIVDKLLMPYMVFARRADAPG
jgi:hypothetical protein